MALRPVAKRPLNHLRLWVTDVDGERLRPRSRQPINEPSTRIPCALCRSELVPLGGLTRDQVEMVGDPSTAQRHVTALAREAVRCEHERLPARHALRQMG